MYRIRISTIVYPDKSSHYTNLRKYQVPLGNGLIHYFGSEKEAHTFLAQANRFLNQCLHEVNFIYISTFSIYRQYWFYFDNEGLSDNRKYRDIGKEIINSLMQIEQTFESCVYRTKFPNGNYFAFSFLRKIVNLLGFILMTLKEVGEIIAYKDQLHAINNNIIQLNRLIDRIHYYGKKQFSEFPDNDDSFNGFVRQFSLDFLDIKSSSQ